MSKQYKKFHKYSLLHFVTGCILILLILSFYSIYFLTLMKRQLKKAVFFPASKEILINKTDSSVKTFRQWYRMHKSKFWKLFFHHTRYFPKWIKQKRYLKNYSYAHSIWKIIRKAQSFGYLIILYPDNNSGLTHDEYNRQVQFFKDTGLASVVLENEDSKDIIKAINKFNINPHNSFFVSKNYNLLEEIFHHFFPLEDIKSFKQNNAQIKGFKYIYLDESMSDSLVFYVKDAIKHSPPQKINFIQIVPQTRLRATKKLQFLEDKIIYIEETENKEINSYIRNNYNSLHEKAKAKGCDFIYLPYLLSSDRIDLFKEYVNYMSPGTDLSEYSPVIQFVKNLSSAQLTQYILQELNFPEFKTPALIRNKDTIFSGEPLYYSCVSFDENKNIEEQFERYFELLQPAHDASGVHFRLAKTPGEDKSDSIETPRTVDDNFEEIANILADDVIQKIEFLKKEGMNSLLAEIALKIFEGNEPKLLGKIENTPAIQKLATSELSKLHINWTSKYYFEVILPDYGNLVIDMPRLPKTLYYFFLKHPEGIMLNNLSAYREELFTIYSKLSNLSDKNEIAANINRLVDPYDNSINVNFSRIKNAFVKVINDELAKNYYITGERGKPKKIFLPSEYIFITKDYN